MLDLTVKAPTVAEDKTPGLKEHMFSSKIWREINRKRHDRICNNAIWYRSIYCLSAVHLLEQQITSKTLQEFHGPELYPQTFIISPIKARLKELRNRFLKKIGLETRYSKRAKNNTIALYQSDSINTTANWCHLWQYLQDWACLWQQCEMNRMCITVVQRAK